MINTNELMLGNLVEYMQQYAIVTSISKGHVDLKINEKYYRGAHCKHINPIELTDDVLKNLGMRDCNWKYIHQLQNRRIVMEGMPLDTTPLLKPKPILTTHDGVDVFDGDTKIWSCRADGVRMDGEKDAPLCCTPNSKMKGISFLYFSTESACSNYINTKWAELHPEPIFVTEDGVGIYNNQTYYYCRKNGFDGGNKCNICSNSRRFVDGMDTDLYVYFSTLDLAQAYLNKVWAETEYQSLLKSTQCQNK